MKKPGNAATSARIAAIAVAAVFLAAGGGFASCSKPDSYYITGDAAVREELSELFPLLSEPGSSPEERFALIQRICERLYDQGEGSKLAVFLTSYVRRAPDDPYGAYYFYMVAKHYLQQDSKPLAALYFDRIVRDYADLAILGESLHYSSLSYLVELVDDPARRVEYFKTLLARFPEKINASVCYFLLAQAYEKLGEWSLAIDAYDRYSAVAAPVPGYPDAVRYAKKTVVFDSSDKSWTYESLDKLVAGVKAALAASDTEALRGYMAKVNFFTISWEQDESETFSSSKDETQSQFWFENFMGAGTIQYASSLDKSSNANEALLRTWGWSDYKLKTWYFSFRKVNFPADPEVHGRWEWVGIYFGDKE